MNDLFFLFENILEGSAFAGIWCHLDRITHCTLVHADTLLVADENNSNLC